MPVFPTDVQQQLHYRLMTGISNRRSVPSGLIVDGTYLPTHKAGRFN